MLEKRSLGRNKVLINSVVLADAEIKYCDVKINLAGWSDFDNAPRKPVR